MSREWKPGDVALVTCKTPPLQFAATRTRKGWNSIDDAIGFAPDYDVVGARPLLLIDPEDREQVDRLAQAMHESDHIAPWHDLHNETRSQIEDAMQAALREFANPTPPKPEEPTGLGAVVEDADGVRHVRVYGGLASQQAWLGHVDDDGGDRNRRWSDINAVRVLSEGVS